MRDVKGTAEPAGNLSMEVGQLKITFIEDGYRLSTPTTDYPRTTDELWSANSDYLDKDGYLVMSLGALLVESSDHKVLIDCGFGPSRMRVGIGPDGMFHSDDIKDGEFDSEMVGGTLMTNLAQLGVGPDEIEAIAYSHLHLDHTGWICGSNGEAMFPNAKHYVDTTEWEYWTGTPSHSRPSDAMIAVWNKSLELTSGPTTLFPFLKALPTPGHTPGHCSHLLTSGKERMMVVGDAMHCPVEVVQTDVAFGFDADPAAAFASRQAIADECAKPNTVVAGVHFPKVFGRLVKHSHSISIEFDLNPVIHEHS